MNAVRHLWARHRIAFVAFLLALSVTVFFAARLLFFLVYWADPARQDQDIAGWMTLGYVARSWDIPPETLANGLGIPEGSARGHTLAELAAARGMPVVSFADEITAVIAAARAAGAGGTE
ncbi:MAG: hypothetical protein KDE08_15945 [Rhodobacteraceae bacterium]|nr:hypothetical protein [Paracoccaceae bacterium]